MKSWKASFQTRSRKILELSFGVLSTKVEVSINAVTAHTTSLIRHRPKGTWERKPTAWSKGMLSLCTKVGTSVTSVRERAKLLKALSGTLSRDTRTKSQSSGNSESTLKRSLSTTTSTSLLISVTTKEPRERRSLLELPHPISPP